MKELLKQFGGRVDFSIISKWVENGARVLDLGCGDGDLLQYLIENKNVRGMGIEVNQKHILNCIERGIPVIQQDLNQGMSNFRDQSFDYVILSQTLQVMHHPSDLMLDMLRIGRYGVVSFPNFAHYSMRVNLMLSGMMPKSKTFPYEWYNTPNIHNITINDFRSFCKKHGVEILKEYHIRRSSYSESKFLGNFMSVGAVALVTLREDSR